MTSFNSIPSGGAERSSQSNNSAQTARRQEPHDLDQAASQFSSLMNKSGRREGKTFACGRNGHPPLPAQMRARG